MSKQGMARPEWTHTRPHNSQSPVPEIQGKAKHGKQKANPIIPGTSGADLKVFHSKPFPYPALSVHDGKSSHGDNSFQFFGMI